MIFFQREHLRSTLLINFKYMTWHFNYGVTTGCFKDGHQMVTKSRE